MCDECLNIYLLCEGRAAARALKDLFSYFSPIPGLFRGRRPAHVFVQMHFSFLFSLDYGLHPNKMA